jgi:hypothetical protein
MCYVCIIKTTTTQQHRDSRKPENRVGQHITYITKQSQLSKHKQNEKASKKNHFEN